MKTLSPSTSALAVATSLCLGAISHAQDSKQVVDSTPAYETQGMETELDLPATFHKYYGQQVNRWRDTERRIAKLDMDGDMNYDGTIDNEDPADNGAFESTPPGLQVGKGELTKLLIRVRPYRLDYRGEVVIGLEVAGINRAVKSGQFGSFEEEVASTGRIRVWRDAAKTELLLDSADPEMRYYEWVADHRQFPANLPGIYPRMVYVEGVSVAGEHQQGGGKELVSGKGVVAEGFPGDLRLLVTIAHREEGADRENYPEYRKRFVKAFRTSFDHVLFTVRPEGVRKEFINGNAEGVWLDSSTGQPLVR